MSKNTLKIFEALDKAIEAELSASKFYSDSAKKVVDERGKNLLMQLSRFEQNHYNILIDLKKKLSEDGQYIEYTGTEFEPYKVNIKSEIDGNIVSDKADVLDIVTFAMNAEDKAYEHYSNIADNISDSKGKELFKKLAEEEKLHYRILADEFYMISNEGGAWSWGD